MNDNELTELIIGCAIRVHRQLGPGSLESVYEECLVHELCKAGLSVERQPIMPVVYDGLRMDSGYRIDIWVEKRIIIELKAVELLTDVHFAQLMTYLRLANCRLGLLINFNVVLLKNGIKRVANGY
jgi:GxxExxY protein